MLQKVQEGLEDPGTQMIRQDLERLGDPLVRKHHFPLVHRWLPGLHSVLPVRWVPSVLYFLAVPAEFPQVLLVPPDPRDPVVLGHLTDLGHRSTQVIHWALQDQLDLVPRWAPLLPMHQPTPEVPEVLRVQEVLVIQDLHLFQ